jgi:hypothetical protein
MMSPLASLSFSDAAEEWLVQHRRYIAARTIADYQQYIKALSQFFKMQLSEIHIGHIREYQDWRGKAAGATRINAELSALQQILKEAGLWKDISGLYKPFPVPKTRCGKYSLQSRR